MTLGLDMAVFERLRMRGPGDIESAAICLRDVAMGMCRVRVAATHNIASSRPMVDGEGRVLAATVFGFDDLDQAWWLAPNLAFSSPLAALCRLELDPFWCNAAGVWTDRGQRAVLPVDLSDFERRAMTRSALVVPVHMPLGQVGAVSFLPVDTSSENLSEMFAAHADVLGIYARRFIGSYARLLHASVSLHLTPNLTRREVECLRWASRGKTNEEIALILDVTRSTVRFHIRNASEKLDAVNRDQTVYKAAQLGYLALSP